MRSTRLPSRLLCLLALAALVVARPAQAEEVNKRFRLSVGLGFLNGQGKAESDSANTLFLTDNTASVVDTYTDPRNDSAVFGSLEFQPGPLASISGQYAFTRDRRRTSLLANAAPSGDADAGNVPAGVCSAATF